VNIAEVELPDRTIPELEAQIDQALSNRSEIALLGRSIRSKDSEALASKSEFYPRIELTGKYQQDGDDPGASNNDFTNQYNASLGVQARWTFFEFGKTRSTAARMRAERRALEQALEKARNDIRLQVVEARLALNVALSNIDTATSALKQAQEHWRITNLLYQQQLTTSTEVLDARSYLDGARSAYHEAHYGYGSALARLEWATGEAP
jgi:outer membrane protein